MVTPKNYSVICTVKGLKSLFTFLGNSIYLLRYVGVGHIVKLGRAYKLHTPFILSLLIICLCEFICIVLTKYNVSTYA